MPQIQTPTRGRCSICVWDGAHLVGHGFFMGWSPREIASLTAAAADRFRRFSACVARSLSRCVLVELSSAELPRVHIHLSVFDGLTVPP